MCGVVILQKQLHIIGQIAVGTGCIRQKCYSRWLLHLNSPALVSMMPLSITIITETSSSISLAITKHLLSKGCKVMMADINPPKDGTIDSQYSENVAFQKADVSVWND